MSDKKSQRTKHSFIVYSTVLHFAASVCVRFLQQKNSENIQFLLSPSLLSGITKNGAAAKKPHVYNVNEMLGPDGCHCLFRDIVCISEVLPITIKTKRKEIVTLSFGHGHWILQ